MGDRFDTGLVHLNGDGGLFAQVNGRTSKVLIEWLQAQHPDWLASITHISMDTSATSARAARLALPNAVVVVDRFHLVALANRAVTEYRRELAWARRGRRGRKTDPEWAQRNRLLRAAETLTDDELAKVHDAMRRADPSGGLEKCWQGKELLRSLLKLAGTNPDRSRIFNALTAFYLHCADSEIAQLRRLAWTVHAWQNSIIAGLRTGISNGRTEGYNRIVKDIDRTAFGFRYEANQKQRIRYACTRKSRASTSSLKPCQLRRARLPTRTVSAGGDPTKHQTRLSPCFIDQCVPERRRPPLSGAGSRELVVGGRLVRMAARWSTSSYSRVRAGRSRHRSRRTRRRRHHPAPVRPQ